MNLSERLRELLPAIGHRNWILVADFAYPQMCLPGIETLVDPRPLEEVLWEVLRELRASANVRPVAVLDEELFRLRPDEAPGVEEVRATILAALEGVSREPRLHEEILDELAKVASRYTVTVIKTTTTVPYTTVFFRLECGYWSDESEASFRARVAGEPPVSP